MQKPSPLGMLRSRNPNVITAFFKVKLQALRLPFFVGEERQVGCQKEGGGRGCRGRSSRRAGGGRPSAKARKEGARGLASRDQHVSWSRKQSRTGSEVPFFWQILCFEGRGSTSLGSAMMQLDQLPHVPAIPLARAPAQRLFKEKPKKVEEAKKASCDDRAGGSDSGFSSSPRPKMTTGRCWTMKSCSVWGRDGFSAA